MSSPEDIDDQLTRARADARRLGSLRRRTEETQAERAQILTPEAGGTGPS